MAATGKSWTLSILLVLLGVACLAYTGKALKPYTDPVV